MILSPINWAMFRDDVKISSLAAPIPNWNPVSAGEYIPGTPWLESRQRYSKSPRVQSMSNNHISIFNTQILIVQYKPIALSRRISFYTICIYYVVFCIIKYIKDTSDYIVLSQTIYLNEVLVLSYSLPSQTTYHGPLARYAKFRVRMRRECRERSPRYRR